jgi:hypothetical protein
MEQWTNLNTKQVMTKMTQIMDKYKQNVPEHLYIEIMNAAKAIYDKFHDDDDTDAILEEVSRDPVKLRYEVIARMSLIEKAKKDMNDFKPVKRITAALKEQAIRSYCKYRGVRIPVYTWECLRYYGYTQNIPVSESSLYKFYKSHHNEKLKLYREMYTIEKINLKKILS